MNIFFVSENPFNAAISLNYPKLQNKMIVEGCQLLCTTFEVQGIKSPYNPSFQNHPSRLWLDNSMANVMWLLEHTQGLLDLYAQRSLKRHKCADILEWCENNIDSLLQIPKIELTPPYLAMKTAPDIRDTHSAMRMHSSIEVWVSHDLGHAVQAYRAYMRNKWYWSSSYSFVN